jgi:hypothetical protein
MDDGEMKSLGPVVGKTATAALDGRDGFGFDDLDVNVLDDDRTIEFAFRRGEEKAFTLKWPTVIYRDVFKAGEQYAAGDAVTWGGSFGIATTRRPERSPTRPRQRLEIGREAGRDGKDAKPNG